MFVSALTVSCALGAIGYGVLLICRRTGLDRNGLMAMLNGGTQQTVLVLLRALDVKWTTVSALMTFRAKKQRTHEAPGSGAQRDYEAIDATAAGARCAFSRCARESRTRRATTASRRPHRLPKLLNLGSEQGALSRSGHLEPFALPRRGTVLGDDRRVTGKIKWYCVRRQGRRREYDLG